jgi:CBS domain-containing protein
MVGVVTKTDILAQLARDGFRSGLDGDLDAIMTRDVTSCRPRDPILNVWLMMNQLGIDRVPVIDSAHKPLGIVYGRDALQVLLEEAQMEDGVLRDYIMGVGYH